MNDPNTNGFSAGPSKDGTEAYVGHGKATQNNCNQNPCPGKITTNPLKPGISMACNNAENFDNSEVYYLLKHDDLRWVRTDIYAMQNLTKALKVTSYSGSPFLYGRIRIGDHYQVGKVHNGNGAVTAQFLEDGNNEIGMLFGFDVLVCDSSIPKPAPKTLYSELPTPPPKCGDVVKYDVVNSRLDPETNGFSGGLYKDGSSAYVGVGNSPACTSSVLPGRITTDVTKPGIYMACGTDVFDKDNVYYMLNHTALSWVPTVNVAHYGLPGALRVFDAAGHSYYYARKPIGTYTQVSKVWNSYGKNELWYTENGKELSTTAGFDVLTCNPPTCGAFAKYDAKVNFTAPEVNGVVGGAFEDGRKAYVGYGNNWGQNCQLFPCPGRISTDPTKKGTYVPCGGEYLDTDYGYYLLNHPDLRWVETDYISMRTLKGAVTITADNGHPFLFGRIKLGDRYAIGKVHNGKGIFRLGFMHKDNNEVGIFYGFEVLVCNSAIQKP